VQPPIELRGCGEPPDERLLHRSLVLAIALTSAQGKPPQFLASSSAYARISELDPTSCSAPAAFPWNSAHEQGGRSVLVGCLLLQWQPKLIDHIGPLADLVGAPKAP